MAGITASTGIASGIDYGKLIDQLMQIEQQPKVKLQAQIDKTAAIKQAYSDVATQISGLRTTASTLSRASTFGASAATSSNENVLTATAGNNAAVGSYQFRVAQMVTAQQTISKGFSSPDSTSLGPVRQTVTLDGSDPGLNPHVPLSWLRGGLGVSAGSFQITNSAGTKATVTTAGATSLEQVVNLINSTNIGVKATYTSDGISLTDSSGGTGHMAVADLYGGSTATKLGIAQTATGSTINGGDLRYLSVISQLSSLNGGRGVRAAGGNVPDFTITTADGTAHTITLGSNTKTIQQVLTAINTQTGGSVTAAVGPANSSYLTLTDNTSGGSTFSVAAAGNSNAAADLGLLNVASGNTITGSDIQTGLNTAQVVGAVTLSMGGGEINTPTQLAQLNGGAGVGRGLFRITDRSGASATIDTSSAITLEDVAKQINGNVDISVRAQIKGDGLVLTDLTGKTASNLTIRDLGNGTAAKDLGIAQDVASSTLTGSSVNYLGDTTALSALNDGRGVRTVGASTADFRMTVGANQFDVTLDGSRTLGDVISKINAAASGSVLASVGSDGKSIQLKDLTSSGTFSVSALNNSKAMQDLGLTTTASADTISGTQVLSNLGTVMLSSLNGGQGLTLGKVNVIDRSGKTDTVDLSSCRSVQDVIDKFNAMGNAKLVASVKSSGNGIQLTDASGGGGSITVSNGDGTNSADALGLTGSFDTSYSSVLGADLHRQWVTEGTSLSQLNGGKGITAGSFKITSAGGTSATVDLSNAANLKLSDVISAINSAKIGVTASINQTGNGLLLTDTTGKAGKLKVEELGGTTAADLHIKGEGIIKAPATSPTIDGAYAKTYTITSADTLQTLQDRINADGFGVSAAILNDGSAAAPYRLSLTARNSGLAGRVLIDSGTTQLGATNLVNAQDAVVFVGGSSSGSLMVTSSTNTISKVISGVTLQLQGASDQPVTINVTRNIDDVTKKLTDFATAFNATVDKITDLTKYDSDPKKQGLLLGDYTMSTVQQKLYSTFSAVVSGAGTYKVGGAVGLKLDDNAHLQFDEQKFRDAYAIDPTSVQKLFTFSTVTNGKLTQSGLGYLMQQSMMSLVDPSTGVLTESSKTLDAQTLQYNQRMKEIDDRLTTKRQQLTTQFANLEGTLSTLQGQQSALSQWASQNSASSSSSSKA